MGYEDFVLASKNTVIEIQSGIAVSSKENYTIFFQHPA
jgi:hypothetical protein